MSKWIEFVNFGTSDSGKTRVWMVYPTGNRQSVLGEIKWYGPWRKYCFYSSNANAVFEQDCLRHIADFIVQATRAHNKPEQYEYPQSVQP